MHIVSNMCRPFCTVDLFVARHWQMNRKFGKTGNVHRLCSSSLSSSAVAELVRGKGVLIFFSRSQCQRRHELSVTANLLGKLADFFLGHAFVSISSLSHLA